MTSCWSLTWYRLDEALLHHAPFSEVGHGRPLFQLVARSCRPCKACPVVAGLLKLGHALLKCLLLPDEVLHLLKRVLPGEVLKDHQPLPEILILVLQLEDLRVLVVNQLRLLLDSLSQAQIPLQHFLHHVDGVDDPASDGVLGLVGRVVTETTLGDHSARRADPLRIDTINFIPRWDTWLVGNASVLEIGAGTLLSDGRVLPLQYFLAPSSIVLACWSELSGIEVFEIDSVRPSDPA